MPEFCYACSPGGNRTPGKFCVSLRLLYGLYTVQFSLYAQAQICFSSSLPLLTFWYFVKFLLCKWATFTSSRDFPAVPSLIIFSVLVI